MFEHGNGRPKALFVNDGAETPAALDRSFSECGFDLMVARTVRQCAICVLEHEPEVIVMDAEGHYLDALLRSVRAMGADENTRILVVGTHRADNEKDVAGIMGVDGYVNPGLNFQAMASEAKRLFAAVGDRNGAARYSGRVLLAEKSPLQAMLVTMLLQEVGINCLHAKTGKSAIRAATAETFEMILMSDDMPDLNCATFMSQMKQEGISIPAVAMAHNWKKGTEHHYLRDGLEGCIPMPPSRSATLTTIGRLLKPVKGAPEQGAMPRIKAEA